MKCDDYKGKIIWDKGTTKTEFKQRFKSFDGAKEFVKNFCEKKRIILLSPWYTDEKGKYCQFQYGRFGGVFVYIE